MAWLLVLVQFLAVGVSADDTEDFTTTTTNPMTTTTSVLTTTSDVFTTTTDSATTTFDTTTIDFTTTTTNPMTTTTSVLTTTSDVFTTTTDSATTTFNTTTIAPCIDRDGKKMQEGEWKNDLTICSWILCQNGVIITVPYCYSGDSGCCSDDDNYWSSYCPGHQLYYDGCVPKFCRNGTWVLDKEKTTDNCMKCQVFNDPHFNDFSGNTFDWHVGCNHALVQDGQSFFPDFGVFMDFDRQGSIGYVGGPTTYKEDINLEVVLYPGNYQLTVKGLHGVTTKIITATVPTQLYDGGAVTTVWAWKIRDCIRLYGRRNILVELCPREIVIWANSPYYGYSVKRLGGLCGRTVGGKDLLFERNPPGTSFPSPNAWVSANDDFGYSWQARVQTKPECPASPPGVGGPQRKLTTKEAQADELRKGCQDFNTSPYLDNCNNVYKDAGLPNATQGSLYEACLFDLCIAATDPESPVTVEEMLEQHQSISANAKAHEDNTIEFIPVGAKCPTDWSPVGRQCFQVHQFNENLSFEDAEKQCINATLAHPRDVYATNMFLQGNKDKVPYWLGGRITGGAMEWLIGGGMIPKDQFLIGVPREDTNKPNNCLEIQPPLENKTTGERRRREISNKNTDAEEPNNYQEIQPHLGKMNTGTQQRHDISKRDTGGKKTRREIIIQVIQRVIQNNNVKNEEIEPPATTTEPPINCIKPDIYICERDPLV